ncbi:MAG: hypothetical protein Q8K45_18380 [Rubrivivax sp.]|nr:hypothetical protein [Rubrivivax sp.]
MAFALRSISAAAAACVLASCGGGSAKPPPGAVGSVTPPVVTATSGRAVDGYISGATALCDLNGNGTADTGEASVTTDATGLYTFAAGCNAVVMVTGGTNVDTGLPFKGVLKAPAGAAIASPLTTLMVAGMTLAQVNAAVGLPAGTALTTLDPAARNNGSLSNADLLKRTLALQQLLQKASELLAGLGGNSSNAALQALYTEVVAAFAAQLPSAAVFGSTASSAADSAVVTSLVKAAAQRVATATAVPAEVRSAVSAINADSLAQVVAGGMKFQADAILAASGSAIPTVGGTQQGDGRITAFVQANAAALAAAPGAATAALAGTLTGQISGSAPPATGPVIGANGELVSFEESTPPLLTGFGGAEDSTVVTDPVSNSGKVAKVVKAAGSEVWAGTTVSVGPSFSIARVPFTATATTLTVRVWSPDANIPVRLKLEDAADDKKSVETEARTTVANAWQTLSFNFANPAAGTAALNLATTYNKASIFFNFGTAGTGKTYYFDDLGFGAGSAPPVANNYLALAADSISLVNGSVITPYSMTQFQSDAGINVSWPLPSPALLRVQINEIGNYVIPAGQKVSAAVSITETTADGKGEVQAYVDNVDVSKTPNGLQVTVPAGSMAMVYGVSGNGTKKAVIDFSGDVSTGLVSNLLKTATGTSNDILLGSIVNFAVNKVSNDFTGIYGLRGKYRVTIVLTDLPLRKADGSALPQLSVTVPTALNATGGVAASKVVTGTGLTGFITLTD